MKNVLFALFAYVVFAVSVLLWLPLMLLLTAVTAPFDPTRRIVGRTLRLCAVFSAACCALWRLTLQGQRLPPGPFVAVANHESMVDIFLLSKLPREMKWFAKASLFHKPWVGLMFRLSGDIPVHRGDRESGAQALERAKWYLSHGMPVMIFPEGTRSTTGELLPFKTGAFRLAIETGVPIVPIALHGASEAMPKGSPWIGRAAVTARVLAPVDVKGLQPSDADRLSEQVRTQIAGVRKELVLRTWNDDSTSVAHQRV